MKSRSYSHRKNPLQRTEITDISLQRAPGCGNNGSFVSKVAFVQRTATIHQGSLRGYNVFIPMKTQKGNRFNGTTIPLMKLIHYDKHLIDFTLQIKMVKILQSTHLFIAETSLQRTPFRRINGVRYREVLLDMVPYQGKILIRD